MARSKTQLSRRRYRDCRLTAAESLEQRIALDASGVVWGNAPYLTLSFAPDGTQVAGKSSELFDYMSSVGDAERWQEAILRAFQTWSVNINADIGVVEDGGQPFGVDGNAQADVRFGDIRLGAIPLNRNVFAVGVTNGFVAGTWSGDILFDPRVSLATVDEVFAVALHEAGHVLGLDDTDNALSPMFHTGIPAATVPSADDLAELLRRFGLRAADRYDIDLANDSPDNATDIRGSESDGYDGSTPLIVHADIAAGDLDVYRFDTLDSYPVTGIVTFEVRTDKISLLQPRMTIRDRDGVLLGSSSTSQVGGDRISVHLTNLDPDTKYYITVEGNSDGLYGVGGYSLVTTFDDWLVTSPETIDKYAGGAFRFLDQDEIQDILAGESSGAIPFLGDDGHTNDTLLTATPLGTTPGFVDATKYDVLASLSDITDVDFYEIKSATYDVGVPRVMTVLVENVNREKELAVDVTVFDRHGNTLSHTNLLNHDGRRLVQLASVESDKTHFVRIETASDDVALSTGNYRLTVVADTRTQELEPLMSGRIADAPIEQLIRVDKQQLFMLAYEGSALNATTSEVSISLNTRAGTELWVGASRADQFRSFHSLLLNPGWYRLRIVRSSSTDEPIDFAVQSVVVTDPLAVPIRDPNDTPVFQIDESAVGTEFVFNNPGGGGPPTANLAGGPSGHQAPMPCFLVHSAEYLRPLKPAAADRHLGKLAELDEMFRNLGDELASETVEPANVTVSVSTPTHT